MKKIIFSIFLCFSMTTLTHIDVSAKEVEQLIFHTDNKEEILRVNSQELIPPFHPDIQNYHLNHLTALNENIISLGNQTKSFKLKQIDRFKVLEVFINNKKYRLHLYPEEMPYQILNQLTNQKPEPCYFLTAPFEGSCKKGSFAYLFNEKGNLLYYQKAPQNKCFSDFKQHKLKNGSVLYSVMQQEAPMPPHSYWSGSLLVLDKNFNQVNKLKVLETGKHPSLGIENHDSIILDENHYILSAYHQKEVLHPETDEPIYIAETVIQEIKNNEIVFDWTSSDYPELLKLFKYPHPYHDVPSWDYLHFNSIIIDPKDNNFILSFASISTLIKINRKTGEIIWKLGGLGDEFGLSQDDLFYGQHSLSFTHDGYLMIFDNQSLFFAEKIIQEPKTLQGFSRILKFKLDEKNKKILSLIKINLDFQTDSLGSVYETEKNNFIISAGRQKKIQKMSLENKKENSLYEIEFSIPTYRAYEVKSLY